MQRYCWPVGRLLNEIVINYREFFSQFCILLLLIFLCELGIGIAGYVKHGELENILEKGFNQTMADYSNHEDSWDMIQKEVNDNFWGSASTVYFHSEICILDDLLWY